MSLDDAQRELYDRLGRYSFDEEGTARSFRHRLADENGWSIGYAERVIEEYRRFIFLALAAAHPVTPSDQVDQAWHLHLTYTHAYWDRFCRGVLGSPIHHAPSRGGSDEAAKFRRWYAHTLPQVALATRPG